MRCSALVLAICGLWTNPVLADEVELTSRVEAVTVFLEGGRVTRTAGFSVPAGTHDLIIRDIPDGALMETLAVRVDGATLLGVTHREDYVPPRDAAPDPRIEAAEAQIETIERRIEAVQDSAARARLAKEAAEIRIGFLTQLGRGEALAGAGADTLRALSEMVGEDAFEARQSALEAEIAARGIERQLEDLEEELERAKLALAALDREDEERLQVTLRISAEAATDGTVSLEYLPYPDWIRWQPAYELRLVRGAAAQLTVQRDALIYQETGENWTDVRMTLSTALPFVGVEPSYLHPKRRYIVPPAPPPSRKSGADALMAEPVAEAPMVVEESSGIYAVDSNGLSFEYAFSDPVSLVSGADVVRLQLDEIALDAEVFAQAVPSADDTAFLMARVTNTSGELLLESVSAGRYVDGGFIGSDFFEGLAAGDEMELPFGPIDGLRLAHDLIDRSSGDRGFISKSNAEATREEFVVRNLTEEDWPVRVLAAVPYSEQDDLQIDWTASPPPSEEDVDKRRGILAWDLELGAGEETTIRLDTTLSWPEDMILR
ncbi:mucoidy inhibitor MuiA family protein [Seohaeicola saemankumensis]|nr:mucoidy inhibitor MuiA family protein [Seohaeicola saemankumensis]MCA0870707.1 mucoidy inhibitor MuiA family protein [Seohaeicola saemankumensis]